MSTVSKTLTHHVLAQWWTADDYTAYFANVAKLRGNFVPILAYNGPN
jgi:hypothetical protein